VTELPIDSEAPAPLLSLPTRPVSWTVRREFWENRSLYLAPLIVAALVFFGFLISTVVGHWQRMLATGTAASADQIAQPFTVAEGMIMAAMVIVGIFYCVDAMHSERRDRSILFWKSLPVSDTTTVLAKASIPILILPLLTFVITLATHLLMLLVSSVALSRSAGVSFLWTAIPWPSMWLGLLQHLIVVHGLRYAPLYAWLLFVSATARRAPFIWAALPLVAFPILEKMAFGTSHFLAAIEQMLSGGPDSSAFFKPSTAPMSHHASAFAGSPSFWIGLVVAAVFIGLTIRARRYRGPV